MEVHKPCDYLPVNNTISLNVESQKNTQTNEKKGEVTRPCFI